MTEAPITQKSMDWFLRDRDIRHKRVNCNGFPITDIFVSQT